MGDGGELHTIYLTNALNVLHKLGIPWSKMHIEKEMTGVYISGDKKVSGLTPDITIDSTKEYESCVVEIETDPANVPIKVERYERINKIPLFIEPGGTSVVGSKIQHSTISEVLSDIQIQLESQIHKVDRKKLRSKNDAEYRKSWTEKNKRYRKGSGRA